MGKGKELESPEGWGGSEVAKRPQPDCAKRNGGRLRSPGVPPTNQISHLQLHKQLLYVYQNLCYPFLLHYNRRLLPCLNCRTD